MGNTTTVTQRRIDLFDDPLVTRAFDKVLQPCWITQTKQFAFGECEGRADGPLVRWKCDKFKALAHSDGGRSVISVPPQTIHISLKQPCKKSLDTSSSSLTFL